MRHLATVIGVLGLVLLGTCVSLALAAGPPPGLRQSLTASGRVIWNLDALVKDTFGNRVGCYDAARSTVFVVPYGSDCPGPAARYSPYEFTFKNASRSEFRLVRLGREPMVGATSVAVRFGSRYVSCPGGQYHHGGRGWLVIGGDTGPNGWFWCN